jgi:hypothetical protein
VRVHKGAQGQLEVSSWTHRVDALESAGGGALWLRASLHNFAYASVDHARRHVSRDVLVHNHHYQPAHKPLNTTPTSSSSTPSRRS